MSHKNIRFVLKQSIPIFFISWFLVLMQNCAPAQFSSAASSANGGSSPYGDISQPNVNPGSCHMVLHQQTVPVKILFVVDTSGSNRLQVDHLPPSDPQRLVRAGSIQAFFNDLKAKPNFHWGFITFSGVSAQSLIADGFTPIFSVNPLAMQNALNVFATIQDNGGTPYRAALGRVLQTLQSDSQASPDTKYVVVFLSDGIPDPAVSDSELVEDIMSRMNAKPNRVSFNTVYYGAANPQASSRLSFMASLGQGRFLDTNVNPTGNSFMISNIVNVPGQVCTP